MENAFDAYKNELRELDKFESPTFTVGDFNYFWNSTTDQYIATNVAGFDIDQKSLDDLRAIVNLGDALIFTSGTAPLPDKYRHVLGMEVTLKFIEDYDGYKKDDLLVKTVKRMRTNRKGFAKSNAFQRPSYKSVYYQISKENIQILAGTKVEVISGTLDYIETPEKVYLNPDKTSNYSDPVNNTPLQFPDHVNFELVKLCRRIFLENIESQRYQSTLQEEALRQE